MLGRIRMCVRLALLVLGTFAIYATWIFGRPFVQGERSIAWRRRIYVAWARFSCRVIGMQRTRRGDVPPAPCVIVANHQGYVDVAFVAAELGAVFVSMAEVREWPIIGAMSAQMGTLFVARERKRELPEVNRTIAEALSRGERVVIFPEGTSTDGSRILPFRAPLFESAIDGSVDVRIAAIRYRTSGDEAPAGEVVAWGDRSPFSRHALRLLRVKRFEAELRVDRKPLGGGDRKELAQRAEARVRNLFASFDGELD